MGTLSLIFGIIFICITLIFIGYACFAVFTIGAGSEFFYGIGFAIIFGGVGALLIKKYDSDKKKSENS